VKKVTRDNVIALGNSGTGKTHACLALGLAACQRGNDIFAAREFENERLVERRNGGEVERVETLHRRKMSSARMRRSTMRLSRSMSSSSARRRRTSPFRLSRLAHGGGCGCKLAPSILQQLLAGQPETGPYAQLLVGTETG
jgi:IstB-like ATP binding protein